MLHLTTFDARRGRSRDKGGPLNSIPANPEKMMMLPTSLVRGPRASLLLISAFLALGACALRPSVQHAVSGFEPIAQRLAQYCDSGRFSGVVAVQQRGRLPFIYSCGFSDAARTVPLDPDSNFKLFSTSKIFTAALILNLTAGGIMTLGDPVTKHIPEVPPSWSGVTIRHLLQHQSGIPDLTNELLEAYRKEGLRSHSAAMLWLLNSLDPQEKALRTSPGTKWEYSNFGYEVLALAAERATGREFHELLRRRVLRPARMTGAVIELPTATAELSSMPDPRLAPGFTGTPDDWKAASSFSFVQQGAGALHAGYRDLLAFDRALSRDRVIPPELQRRNAAESVVVNENVRYGYGWMIRQVGRCTYWQHSGGTNGYTSEFARAPDRGIAVVVLSNVGFAPVGELRRDLMSLFLGGSNCES